MSFNDFKRKIQSSIWCKKDIESFLNLIDIRGPEFDINLTDKQGSTALTAITCIIYREPYRFLFKSDVCDIMRKLISAKIDINHQNSHGGNALIFCAACKDPFPEGVDILISAGANLNVKEHRGYTPLMFAAMARAGADSSYTKTECDKILDKLIKAGADARCKANDGRVAYDFYDRKITFWDDMRGTNEIGKHLWFYGYNVRVESGLSGTSVHHLLAPMKFA